jgi:ribosome maturation factor RimP
VIEDPLEAWAVAHAFLLRGLGPGDDGPQEGAEQDDSEREEVAVTDELARALTSSLAGSGIDLFDVEVRGTAVVVTVERQGGIDLDAIAEAATIISGVLDELDPFPGHYTLEVSSPGLERRLRTPAHFARAVGETVSVRTLPGTADTRRVEGRLVAADEDGITVEVSGDSAGPRAIAYDEIERAKTVFAWGATPAPSPSRGKAKNRADGQPGRARTDRERVTTP